MIRHCRSHKLAAVISTLIEAPLYKRGRALASKEMAAEKTTAK